MSDEGKTFWQARRDQSGQLTTRAFRCIKHRGSWRYWHDPRTGTRFKTNGNPFHRSRLFAATNTLMDFAYMSEPPRSFGQVVEMIQSKARKP